MLQFFASVFIYFMNSSIYLHFSVIISSIPAGRISGFFSKYTEWHRTWWKDVAWAKEKLMDAGHCSFLE